MSRENDFDPIEEEGKNLSHANINGRVCQNLTFKAFRYFLGGEGRRLSQGWRLFVGMHHSRDKREKIQMHLTV